MNRASKLDFTFGPPNNDETWRWYHWILLPIYFLFALFFYLILFWSAIFSVPFLWVAERKRSRFRQKLTKAGRTITCDQLRSQLEQHKGTVLIDVRNDLGAYKLHDYEIWYTPDNILSEAPLPLPTLQTPTSGEQTAQGLSAQYADAPPTHAQLARFTEKIRADYFDTSSGESLLMIYPERANAAWTALVQQMLISQVVTVFDDLVTDGKEFKQEMQAYLEERDARMHAKH